MQIPFGNLRATRKGANYVYSKSLIRLVVDDRKKYLVISYVGEQNKRRLNDRFLRLKMVDDQWIDSVTDITTNSGSS